MSGIVITAAVAPLLGAASLRGEQVSQLVLGEGAELLAIEGPMLRVRSALDGYEGWIHEGYAVRMPIGEMEAWLASAAWSDGALLREDGTGLAVRAPHRARLHLDGPDRVRLPTGANASILAGTIRPYIDVVAEARADQPAEWAWREFAGTPYLWGGVTGAGIDCSGLVQTTFLARGVSLPRDASQQAGQGEVVSLDQYNDGDLLFFRASDSDRVAHVAIVAADGQVVHSTVETGGVTRESIAEGSRAAHLRSRLVAARRLG